MEHAQRYLTTVHALLDRIWTTQQEPMGQAVAAMADSVAAGGVVHIFGCGHTQMLCLEVWYRAGQPACISPLFDQGLWPHNAPNKGNALEKLEGYGRLIMQHHDTRPGEVILVLSNSGRNAAPLEVALEARARGLTVVAVTSMDYTTRVPSRHSSGRRLFEIADVVIDNAAPMGDAAMELPGLAAMAGPVTTITNAAILNMLLLELDAALLQRGIEPPVFTSANLDADLSRNAEYIRRYAPRVPAFRG